MGYDTQLLVGDGATISNRGRRVLRATATLPATATGNIFTITGLCLLTQFYGQVTTVIQTQACNVKLVHNPTAAGSNVDLCANLDVSALAVATILGITGTLADAMLSGLAIVGQSVPILLQSGTLALTTSATNTGSVRWGLRYLPLETGAGIVAA